MNKKNKVNNTTNLSIIGNFVYRMDLTDDEISIVNDDISGYKILTASLRTIKSNKYSKYMIKKSSCITRKLNQFTISTFQYQKYKSVLTVICESW